MPTTFTDKPIFEGYCVGTATEGLESSKTTRISYATLLDMWRTDAPKTVAFDTETTGVTYCDMPFCVSLAWVGKAFFVPIEEMTDELLVNTPEIVGHNTKFDIQKLALVGIIDPDSLDPLRVFDTECLAHLLDEHRRKGLKFLAREILGEETDEDEVIKAERRRLKLTKKDGYDKLPREVIEPYALKDAEYTIRLHDILRPQVEGSEDLSRLLQLEQRLTFALLRMETRGMGINPRYVEETARDYAGRALTLELSIRDSVQNEDFNPNSPKQIAEAFAGLGIELESTSKAALAEVEHPLAKQILELRTLRKMHGTYLKAILDEQRDGILHPSYRQHGTKTGRMSSGEAEA